MGSARRLVAVTTMVGTLALAGCGTQSAGSGAGAGTGGGSTEPGQQTATVAAASPAFTKLAETTAANWAFSSTSPAWTTGLVPLQDLTIDPEDGFPDGLTKQAAIMGAYVLDTTLPTNQKPATVRFPDGSTMAVTQQSAAATFEKMRRSRPDCERQTADTSTPDSKTDTQGGGTQGGDTQGGGTGSATVIHPHPATPPTASEPGSTGGSTGARTAPAGPAAPAPAPTGPTTEPGPKDPPVTDPDSDVTQSPVMGCIFLTVTGADLVTTQLRTSRGLATVPVWRFSLNEMAAPIDQVAIDDADLSPVPETQPPSENPPAGMVAAQTLISASGSTVGFTLGVGACDTDITAMVVETETSVVVGGTVSPPRQGVCTDQLLLAPATVTLKAPLADRVVLNALTGRPLVLGWTY